MKRYVIMTALALVLVAPSAHAEYTGGGAMASGPSAPLVSAPPPAQSSGGVGDTMKEKWSKFKDDHEATWEKLEAERKAHWHGISMHVSKGDSGDSKSSESEPQKMPASSSQPATDSSFTPADVSTTTTDSGQRPSRWENFKDKHQAGLASAHDHLDNAKSRLHEDVQKVKDSEWKDKVHDKADAVKDKYDNWKADHVDTIEGAKDKWQAWKDRHVSTQ